MRQNNSTHYVNSIYHCPRCEQNDLLFEEKAFTVVKFFFWTISKKLIGSRFVCKRCKCVIAKENLKTIQQFHFENDSIKKTIEKETFFSNNQLITRTKISTDYSEYIPKVKNKTLYFDMLLMLIDYIDTYQNDINIEEDKFYRLALENASLDPESFGKNLEEEIFKKFNTCIIEFTNTTLFSLLRQSLHVLKGQFTVEPKIEELYFHLFKLMKMGELEYHSYFLSLR